MKNNVLAQVGSTVAFVIIAFFLANPLNVWMPDTMHMAVLAGVVVVFGLFAVFVLSESGGDERDALHRMYASRAAFFAGAGVLLVAIVVETCMHMLDPMLVYALSAMIVAKSIARLYVAHFM